MTEYPTWCKTKELKDLYDRDPICSQCKSVFRDHITDDGHSKYRHIYMELEENTNKTDSQIVKDLKEYFNNGQEIENGSSRDIFADIHEILGRDTKIPQWAIDNWPDLEKKNE